MIREWQKSKKDNFKINNIILDTVIFADDQAIISDREYGIQRAVYLWE
jgi:hypothetical protein